MATVPRTARTPAVRRPPKPFGQFNPFERARAEDEGPVIQQILGAPRPMLPPQDQPRQRIAGAQQLPYLPGGQPSPGGMPGSGTLRLRRLPYYPGRDRGFR